MTRASPKITNRTVLKNEDEPVAIKNQDAMFIRCQASGKMHDGKPAELKFQGYSGDKVDLQDYGFEYPVVYDINGIQVLNKTPILYNHWDIIGHSTSVRKVDNNSAVRGKGVASLPGTNTTKVVEGIKNGFPWEASMGLRLNNMEEDLEFMPKNHTFTVNNRQFVGPMYVARKTTLVEMTVTAAGRDSNTSFELLNSETKMKVQSRGIVLHNSDTPPTPPTPAPTPAPAPAPGKVENTPPAIPPVAPPPVAPPPVVFENKLAYEETLMALLPQYPEQTQYIIKCAKDGYDTESIKNQIEIFLKNKALPPVPGPTINNNESEVQAQVMLIRMSRAMGAKDEILVKKFEEKLLNQADKFGDLQPKELLVTIANNRGGNFTGFSQTEAVVKYIERTNHVQLLNAAPTWSTFDLPDWFAGVGTVIKDQVWQLNPSFALPLCDSESYGHMKEVAHRRITEGEVMKQVGADGKLALWNGGNQVTYKTNIDTYGNTFTWTRKDAINDEWDALKDLMEQMAMGAVILPDLLFGAKMFGDLGAFWINGTNSFLSTALDATSFGAKKLLMESYAENRGKMTWQVMLEQGFKILTTRSLAPTAWDIVEQPTIANQQKNKYYKAAGINVWGNMDNTSAFNAVNGISAAGLKFVNAGAWYLWPENNKFSPFIFRFYNNQRTPVSEAITLPGEFLGSGMRIYWDLSMNEKNNQTVVRCTPSA